MAIFDFDSFKYVELIEHYPPKNTADWYNKGPWVYVNIHFERYFKRPKETLQSWVCFSERNTHEIAHVVFCKDEDIFDPLYGMKFLDDLRVPKEFVLDELSVMSIQCVIRHYTSSSEITLLAIHDIVNLALPILEGDYDVFELADHCRRVINAWPIERVYKEYLRKVKLVRDA